MDTNSTDSKNYKRFKPFLNLLSWWKGRRFRYLVHVDTEEEQSIEERRGEVGPISSLDFTKEEEEEVVPPIERYAKAQKSTGSTFPFMCTAIDSFQDSIESMDSVVDSHYLHPEDTSSQSMVFTNNAHHLDPFLKAHIDFLSQSTQPQEVELMYRLP